MEFRGFVCIIVSLTLVTPHRSWKGGNVGGGRVGSNNNGQYPSATLDCSSSSNGYPKCDQLMENLMGLVLGTPNSNNTKRQPQASSAQTSEIVGICCFLYNLPSARENCCQQISEFCKDVLQGPADCYGFYPSNNSGGRSGHGRNGGPYPDYGGGSHRRSGGSHHGHHGPSPDDYD